MAFNALKHFALSVIDKFREHSRLSTIIRTHLPVFRVNSGNWSRYPILSMENANNFPLALINYFESSSKASKEPGTLSPIKVFTKPRVSPTEFDGALGALFTKYGSDKEQHGYTPVYRYILACLQTFQDVSLLEIGVGTNKPGKISSMGSKGTPGASLLAFDDFLLGKAEIWGADIDHTSFFIHPRIRFVHLDQNSESDWLNLENSLNGRKFGLIIDDGLHSITANMNTVRFARKFLTREGFVVIEDVPDSSLPGWDAISYLSRSIGDDFTILKYRANTNNLILVTRKENVQNPI